MKTQSAAQRNLGFVENHSSLVRSLAYDPAELKQKAKYLGWIAVASLPLVFLLAPIHLQLGKWGFETSRGMLTPGDGYLDGTGHIFQSGSWHMGDGTRLYGSTYGIKIGRSYFTWHTIHGNPNDPLIEPDPPPK